MLLLIYMHAFSDVASFHKERTRDLSCLSYPLSNDAASQIHFVQPSVPVAFSGPFIHQETKADKVGNTVSGNGLFVRRPETCGVHKVHQPNFHPLDRTRVTGDVDFNRAPCIPALQHSCGCLLCPRWSYVYTLP